MSEKSAADDFFGIEHMSSQFGAEEGERKEGSTAENREVEKAFTGLNLEKVDKQQSGTEFFDRAFFGEFKHERITCEQETNHSVDFFEENFFKKLPSESKIAVPFTKKVREQHLCEGVTEDHLQLEGRTVPVRTLRNLQEDVTGKKGQEKVVPPLEEYVENEVVGHRSEEVSGLHNIRSMITPIWRMNDEELVDFMTKRIIYKDDNIIAFDKPYGMAYSGASQHTPQLDRLLQKIKARVAPKCERLHLVKSLDKYQSGVVVFAMNSLVKSELKGSVSSGLVEQVSRCIVRGELSDSPLKITIPLIKAMKERDIKMMPLVTNKAVGEIFYVESECRTIKGNQYVSSVEVITHKEAPHQIRAHLALAGCPLIGDAKYSNSSPRPPRLSHRVLDLLGITDSQSRKIPMYLHLKQIHFPDASKSMKPMRLSAPLPEHFSWILKKLKLLKLK